MSNYKDWIKAIDVNIDYFSVFMKAWIAFNAWYDSGEIAGRTDKEKIENIATTSNRFKNYMKSFVSDTTSKGNAYRESLGKLHESLLGSAITTQEYLGVKQDVSFAQVAVKNSNTNHKFEYRGVEYHCNRASGNIVMKVTLMRPNTILLNYPNNEYNVESLQQQSDFINLSAERKGKCIKCYEELEPYKIESILYDGDEALKVGTYGFISNSDKVSEAIIKVLYALRCALTHGDISPDEASNNVYRYAYEVLIGPLKSLL